MELRATRLIEGPGFELEPAAIGRQWMDDTVARFAYRCLPLSMANQAGWAITCPLDFEAVWDGKAIAFRADDPAEAAAWAPFVGERYGKGVVSFRLPYLFATDPGYGLLVRGPTNIAVPGAHPLDVYLDTGEAEAGFAMDWKLTAPGRAVRFRKGAPICQVLPYPNALLEALAPRVLPLEANPPLLASFQAWSASRSEFLKDPTRTDADWQKDYFQGKTMAGERVHGHKTRLHLAPFEGGGCPVHRSPAPPEG